jgi:SAM-dependent methyltransferase
MADDRWDDHAAGWDSDEDVRAYAELAFRSLTEAIAPLLPDLSERRVLDFGCGTGLLSEKLAPLCREIVAVDTSAGMIAALRDKLAKGGEEKIRPLRTEITATAVTRHPELAETFDLIVASSVCSFLPDYEATLRDLALLLKPGGCFAQWDWSADLPAARIRSAYQQTGWETLVVEEAFALTVEGESLPVVMGLARAPSPRPRAAA